MDYRRQYDISFITDDLVRSNLQNAIDAVNLACSSDTDAWKYVESHEIRREIDQIITANDPMKNIIFEHLSLAGHSSYSIAATIDTLISLCIDYKNCRMRLEEHYQKQNEEESILNNWRKEVLLPFYVATSSGATVISMGPVFCDFLRVISTFSHSFSSRELIVKLEKELRQILGVSDKDCLLNIDKIIISGCTSPELEIYREKLDRSIAFQEKQDSYNQKILKEQINILKVAIESKNIVALNDALYPGWHSYSLINSEEYKSAQKLLDELSSSGVQFDENRA